MASEVMAPCCSGATMWSFCTKFFVQRAYACAIAAENLAAFEAGAHVPTFAVCGNGLAGLLMEGEVTLFGHSPLKSSTSSTQKSNGSAFEKLGNSAV